MAGDGSVYVGGWTNGDLEGISAGSQDGFVRKFDEAGGVVWTRQFGTPSYEMSISVATSSDGSTSLMRVLGAERISPTVAPSIDG